MSAPSKVNRGGLLRIAVSVGLLGLLLALVDLEALLAVVARARPEILLLMFVSLLAERLFAAWRWLVLLRVGEPRIGYRPVLRITFISNFVGTFLPGGVGIEVLRVYGLARALSDLPLALSSVLVERLCGLLALMLMIALGLLIAPIPLPSAVEGLLVLGTASLLAAALVLLHPTPRRLAAAILARPPLARVAAPFLGLGRRLATYAKAPGALACSLALALAFQALRVLSVVIGAAALGITVDPLLFFVIVPITILVALAPISMGGLGPREATYVALLGLAGVAPEPALVLALTREALSLLTTLPGAVLYARAPIGARIQPT
jgi:glycosyltransferase 2 family protein